MDIIKKIILTNMGYKPGEKILIVTDAPKKKVGDLFLNAAKSITKDTQIAVCPKLERNGQEPPSAIAEKMRDYEIIFLITSKSLSHTCARRKASEKGARIVSLPNFEERMISGALDADYTEMQTLSKKIVDVLMGSSKIEVTTDLGTKLTMDVMGRKIDEDLGILKKPGDFGNLPAGEVSLSPVERTTQGIFIIDGSIPDIIVEQSIRVEVDKGFATYISDEDLSSQLKQVGDQNAFAIAELGIGINKKARLTGNVLEDEKVYGTCHVAFGNNMSYGGTIDVPIHLDCVIKKPTIVADNKILMKKGNLVI